MMTGATTTTATMIRTSPADETINANSRRSTRLFITRCSLPRRDVGHAGHAIPFSRLYPRLVVVNLGCGQHRVHIGIDRFHGGAAAWPGALAKLGYHPTYTPRARFANLLSFVALAPRRNLSLSLSFTALASTIFVFRAHVLFALAPVASSWIAVVLCTPALALSRYRISRPRERRKKESSSASWFLRACRRQITSRITLAKDGRDWSEMISFSESR